MYARWLESVVAISPRSAIVAAAAVSSSESAASVISNPAQPCEEVVSANSMAAYSAVRSRRSAAALRKMLRRSRTDVCERGGQLGSSPF